MKRWRGSAGLGRKPVKQWTILWSNLFLWTLVANLDIFLLLFCSILVLVTLITVFRDLVVRRVCQYIYPRDVYLRVFNPFPNYASHCVTVLKEIPHKYVMQIRYIQT
jgi:hypothetical protein